MKRKPERDAFASEADFCVALAAAAESAGWSVWPEVGGWDLVLVRNAPCVTPRGDALPVGFQVGVETKLRGNLAAIAAVVDRCRFYDTRSRVPHAVALAVPDAGGAFDSVARALDFVAWTPKTWPGRLNPSGGVEARWDGPGLALPPVPLRGPGGLPSPRVLSKWRVAALRLCHLLATQGYLTRADFKAAGVDWRRWVDNGWLQNDWTDGRHRWVAGPHLEDGGPMFGYAAEYKALAAAGRPERTA